MPLALNQRVHSRIAVSRFRSSQNYQGSSGVPIGGTSMTRIFLLARVRPLAGVEDLATNSDSVNRGWRMRFTAASAIQFRIHDTVAGRIAAFTMTPPFGTIAFAGGSYDGSNIILRSGGLTDSAATPGGGYTAPTENTTIGTAPTGITPAPSTAIFAFLASDAQALTDAELNSYQADVIEAFEQGRDIPFFRTPVVDSDWHWDARDVWDGGSGLAATWTDQISSVALTRAGALEPFHSASRFV